VPCRRVILLQASVVPTDPNSTGHRGPVEGEDRGHADDFGSRYGRAVKFEWAAVDSNHLTPR
jgi:hypothetical protein